MIEPFRSQPLYEVLFCTALYHANVIIMNNLYTHCFRSTGLFESGGMLNRDGSHGRLNILEEVCSTSVPLVDLSKEDSVDSFASAKGECVSQVACL